MCLLLKTIKKKLRTFYKLVWFLNVLPYRLPVPRRKGKTKELQKKGGGSKAQQANTKRVMLYDLLAPR